ncbi:MAG: bifunctional [glutamine synthetase] adenylyltransferase/[glutamine synthetase]-adenylyl-L-tyrosine phosphorylase [Pseudomonadota bacterium]
MQRATDHSPFLAPLVARNAELVDALRSITVEQALQTAASATGETVHSRLRRARAQTMLVLALADLSNTWPLEKIVGALSDFADHALDAAIAASIAAHVPGAESVGFAAIGLGKHGSRELNYSSDLDPIFIYDPETLPRRSREEPVEAAVRIARGVVDLLQTRDGDGFVFRIDLRLRPASEATPIALPVDAAITHYESSALAWERAAYIRSRAAAGDKALGQRFLDTIQPFVWRRSLDFGAIDDLRALTRAIRDHHGHRAFGPGYDLKRGRGGIREVEFFAQIHQLIHGGRNPSLRVGDTLTALDHLSGAGWITGEEVEELATAYRLYRTIEHRLQMVDDRQTHELPRDADALENVARLHGLESGVALLDCLAPHVARVEHMYDALADEREKPSTGEASAPGALGFADPQAVEDRIARWRAGSVRSIRSPAAVSAFEALLPDLLADLSRAPDPDAALARLDVLLGKLSTGVNLFRLLDMQPALRVMLVDILSHAPTLADALALRPSLFDRLVDRTALGPVPDVPALVGEMRGDSALDAEALLDRVRITVAEYRFALGVQIVEGAADPIEVASGYGRVAEAAIDVVASRVIEDFEAAHGRIPGAELVVLALGRMGGGLLTHASDLDLIYLFTGDFQAESDGDRPLGATHYFNRLGQRLSAALSVPTSAGPLYEVDTRLRPSGTQGPLVTSLDSFERYQREAAWTWEHMALARARPVFGSKNARDELAAIIEKVLKTPRDPEKLAADVVSMRAEIAKHKAPKGDLDVKLGQGGLIDLEFAVHHAQLKRGEGLSPDLRVAIAVLGECGSIDPALGAAHDLLTRMLVVLRLVAPDLEPPGSASRALIARACGAGDWDDLLARMRQARDTVTRQWSKVGGEKTRG